MFHGLVTFYNSLPVHFGLLCFLFISFILCIRNLQMFLTFSDELDFKIAQPFVSHEDQGGHLERELMAMVGS